MSTAKVINIVHPSGTITNLVNDANGGIVIGGTLTANANVTVNGTSTFTGTLTAGNINITGNVTGNLTIAGTMTAANANVTGTVVMGSSFKRNRIINGNMLIDQRNAGASVSNLNNNYTLDRWGTLANVNSKFTVQQNAGSVTPPAGFTKYLGVTSSAATTVGASDYYSIYQPIEANNVGDLGWGAAGAQTVTLSFWVRSSLTGTFGGSITNNAGTYSYPFSYSISSANTWTQISITVAGPTAGTWGTGNASGPAIIFGLGVGSSLSGTAGTWTTSNYLSVTGAVSVVGTNGATFYITGVQLEVGTKATPYEMQIYSDQLAQCQRYYQLIQATTGTTSSTANFVCNVKPVVTMRTGPSASQNGVIGISDYTNDYVQSSTSTTTYISYADLVVMGLNNFSGLTLYRPYFTRGQNTNAITLSAEL